MPIDATMLNAMLGTFRTMLQDCRDKNFSGPDMDAMAASLARMEQLGADMNDMGAFSGQLMQEGLMMKFSDHYGKVLAAAAKEQYSSSATGYDEAADQKLLQQTLQAYRDAIHRLEENKQQTRQLLGANAADADVLLHDAAITAAINKLVALGESGITYPQFLCATMQQGLDKTMEGSALSRDAHVYLLDAARATAAAPYYIQKEEKKLALYDRLAGKNSLGVPDTLSYTLGCEKIEWLYQPDINQWNKIKTGWEKTIFWLDEWITAWCAFAPQIQPWSTAVNPREAVVESQHCVPGRLRVWEDIHQHYFGYTLQQLFQHPSFKWDVEHHWLYWSQEYMEFLLRQVEPVCRPGAQPAAALVEQATAFHQQQKKINPMVGEPAARYAAYFDNYFGAGEHEKRFGLPQKVPTNAKPWHWQSFAPAS